MTEMPQAFPDAVCNVRAAALQHAVSHDELDKELRGIDRLHAMDRRRGIEGKNGVACNECTTRALAIWTEYQRILAKVEPT